MGKKQMMLKINFEECTSLEDMYNLIIQEFPKVHGPGYENYILKIRKLISENNILSYRETGTNQGCSTLSAMLSKPKYIETIDIDTSNIGRRELLEDFCRKENIELSIIESDTGGYYPKKHVDFTFVDCKHGKKHVMKVFDIHKNTTNKFIMFHDTNHPKHPGVGVAVNNIIERNKKEWEVYENNTDNIGYIILRKK